MAENMKIICENSDLVAIANAVRSKTGLTTEMTLGQIADSINEIEVGSGECSGTHVIEVTELPTENIDESAVYCIKKPALLDVIMSDEGMTMSYKDYMTSMSYELTKPTENIKVSDMNSGSAIHVYYIEDENDIFIYGDLDGSGTNAWYNGTTVFEGAPNNGVISDISEATESGYYFILGDQGTYYTYKESDKGFKGLILAFGEAQFPLEALLGSNGAIINYFNVKTRPTENIQESDGSSIYNFYYIEDENEILLYVDGEWLDIQTAMNIPYLGVIGEVVISPDSLGLYAMIEDGWTDYTHSAGQLIITENGGYDVSTKKSVLVSIDTEIPDGYIQPSGTITLVTNGEHDVKYYEKAIVNVTVPSSYMAQSVSELPADANDGSFAIVLGGE